VPETVQSAIDRALAAYAALAELGESIEDEWSYVNDLAEAWRGRLAEVATDDPSAPVLDEVSTAIDAAIEEIGSITDPHRAIDWLSTYPQVVLLALGVTP
jgi:hypothetical protein